MSAYNRAECEELAEQLMGDMKTATVCIRFVTRAAGGQPATVDGVKAFVEHHLGLIGTQAEAAVKRIMREEVQDEKKSDALDASNELDERESYGLNIVRKTKKGDCFIGTWMVRAMLKASASRLELFKQKRGAKGDMAEAMLVKPHGRSAIAGIQEIVVLVDGKPYRGGIYERFMGRVGTPQGQKSIVHDSEIIPVGGEIELLVHWPAKRVLPDDMAAIWGLAQRIGLGSVKAMECGRFEIVSLDIK